MVANSQPIAVDHVNQRLAPDDRRAAFDFAQFPNQRLFLGVEFLDFGLQFAFEFLPRRFNGFSFFRDVGAFLFDLLAQVGPHGFLVRHGGFLGRLALAGEFSEPAQHGQQPVVEGLAAGRRQARYHLPFRRRATGIRDLAFGRPFEEPVHAAQHPGEVAVQFQALALQIAAGATVG